MLAAYIARTSPVPVVHSTLVASSTTPRIHKLNSFPNLTEACPQPLGTPQVRQCVSMRPASHLSWPIYSETLDPAVSCRNAEHEHTQTHSIGFADPENHTIKSPIPVCPWPNNHRQNCVSLSFTAKPRTRTLQPVLQCPRTSQV